MENNHTLLKSLDTEDGVQSGAASATCNPNKHKRIAIVGAGLTGLALAFRYAKDGHRVTIYESGEQLGGLATWSEIADTVWDRFYHVILPSDRNLLGLIRELGLGDSLIWNKTYTGFYVNNKLHSISSNLEFLKFPLLSLWSKFRLAWTMLYGSRINNWKKLETLTCEQWLTRVSGRQTYEKMWKPLLLAKLGHSHERTSAVFIWSYIKRMFSARDKSASSEQLGHVSGGYRLVLTTLEDQIEANGGEIRLQTKVSRIKKTTGDSAGLSVSSMTNTSAGKSDHAAQGANSNPQTEYFDEVVCTSPTPVIRQIVDDNLLDYNAASTSGEVEYLGVVCGVLVTHEPLSKYYVINIADSSIDFTGVIGMSNVIPAKYTNSQHLTYLPRYMLSTDKDMEKSDEYYRDRYFAGLEKMFPEFKRSDAITLEIHRARQVQPLQVLGYSQLKPSVKTKHPGLFILNTSQFTHATLNNNEVVSAVEDFYSSRTTKHKING